MTLNTDSQPPCVTAVLFQRALACLPSTFALTLGNSTIIPCLWSEKQTQRGWLTYQRSRSWRKSESPGVSASPPSPNRLLCPAFSPGPCTHTHAVCTLRRQVHAARLPAPAVADDSSVLFRF